MNHASLQSSMAIGWRRLLAREHCIKRLHSMSRQAIPHIRQTGMNKRIQCVKNTATFRNGRITLYHHHQHPTQPREELERQKVSMVDGSLLKVTNRYRHQTRSLGFKKEATDARGTIITAYDQYNMTSTPVSICIMVREWVLIGQRTVMR
ncbi:hypothetical protein G6O67_007811 [Ophiocordyceps sinensis]|uniref:Uncharacterized protein n=1 Tax=Ophiocordyceps sinensis TaxID=72228 RepID=A0A8H4LV38_9HYPO|nr:hypothetical protein G6O67_007811 [Ophiocordyceps sinensis]